MLAAMDAGLPCRCVVCSATCAQIGAAQTPPVLDPTGEEEEAARSVMAVGFDAKSSGVVACRLCKGWIESEADLVQALDRVATVTNSAVLNFFRRVMDKKFQWES